MSAATGAPTPRELFEALIGHIAAGRWQQVADLYARHTVAELSFALPAPASDRAEGREQIRPYLSALSPAGWPAG
ncbi:hypothetical protein ACEZCY_19705 [Streptacidiphilus sp. N1-12]|uniref:SnoaL-like domain-containing protein n=2 Tax=Streptacidiphilus alkalitolerans TaxID=3342712 RepID=A0ABV6X2R6_9ACTN